jgi:hypothetical protein
MHLALCLDFFLFRVVAACARRFASSPAERTMFGRACVRRGDPFRESRFLCGWFSTSLIWEGCRAIGSVSPLSLRKGGRPVFPQFGTPARRGDCRVCRGTRHLHRHIWLPDVFREPTPLVG